MKREVKHLRQKALDSILLSASNTSTAHSTVGVCILS
jgi:hypothetical protein